MLVEVTAAMVERLGWHVDAVLHRAMAALHPRRTRSAAMRTTRDGRGMRVDESARRSAPGSADGPLHRTLTRPFRPFSARRPRAPRYRYISGMWQRTRGGCAEPNPLHGRYKCGWQAARLRVPPSRPSGEARRRGALMIQLLERLPLRPSRGAPCSGHGLGCRSTYEDRANVAPSRARALKTPPTPSIDA